MSEDIPKSATVRLRMDHTDGSVIVWELCEVEMNVNYPGIKFAPEDRSTLALDWHENKATITLSASVEKTAVTIVMKPKHRSVLAFVSRWINMSVLTCHDRGE